MISGLFFGLAFGMGGLGAAVLGTLADHTSIDFVYKVCAFLPALGLFTALLPETNGPDKSRELGRLQSGPISVSLPLEPGTELCLKVP